MRDKDDVEKKSYAQTFDCFEDFSIVKLVLAKAFLGYTFYKGHMYNFEISTRRIF